MQQLYFFLWDVLPFLQACSEKSLFAFQNRILLVENSHQEDRIRDYFLIVTALQGQHILVEQPAFLGVI